VAAVVLLVVPVEGAVAAVVLVAVSPEVEAMSLAVIVSTCFGFLWDESEASITSARLFCDCVFGDSISNDGPAETCSSVDCSGCPSLVSIVSKAADGPDGDAFSDGFGWSSDAPADGSVDTIITYRNVKFHYKLS
jgi:hypothetical protein